MLPRFLAQVGKLRITNRAFFVQQGVSRYILSCRIILDCILLACALGIALDMVTAHIAVEYFTVHHPKVVESKEPWVMALVWGVGAAWWFGALAGVVLAFINGRRKSPLGPGPIRVMMAKACAALWVTMMLILATSYGLIGLIPMAQRGPAFDHDRRLMAVALTHMTEYLLGTVALVIVGFRVWRANTAEPTDAETT